MKSSKSGEIVDVVFKKVERSYYSTPTGWRLATFEEARNGLESIKEQNILEKWDRARLLDGWITGPGYNFEIGNDFKGCLGYMLLIQTQASGCAYADVNISDSQKEVALFLCADDCNYEVVYWLFNSWAKTDSMDLQDVMQGKIPFSNPKKFLEMNRMVCSLARKLGDKGPVSGKADKRRFSGIDSVKDVLSDMIDIVKKENVEQYRTGGCNTVAPFMERSFPRSLKPQWLEDLANGGGADWINIADAFWNFLSECYAGLMVKISSTYIFGTICELNSERDLKTITSSQENFMVSSLILFNLSDWRTVIIHTPLGHDCSFTCEREMLCYIASNNGPPDLPRFNQTLENNAMWRCYGHIGNYNLLKKLLIITASGKACAWLGVKQKTALFAVKRLLQCGAQPGPAYAVFYDYKKVTALHAAVRHIRGEDLKIEVTKSLFNDCGEQQEQLANASDEDGCTALHDACYLGLANTCQILLDYGARLDVKKKNGKTALHIAVEQRNDAVEERNDAVVNVFMKHPQITDVVDLKDNWGEAPLDTAVANTDIELVAKLISKSKQPEAYFDKVDLKQLLRYSLLEGSVYIVTKLFEKGTRLPVGECDEEGKTALHLAATCEDKSRAMEMVSILLEKIKGKEKLVANQDKRLRTALHEAALNGNEELCRYLLDINPKIINLKDRDGRNPIYDAVKGKQNEKDTIKVLLAVYSNKEGVPENVLTDRNGLTPLHVAASLGKKDVLEWLLSSEKKGKEYLKRSDFLGQTALHKAANCGDRDTVQILLDKGAHPLQERDCDGRTALHYAVNAKTGGDKIKLAGLILQGCKTIEEKWLLLWASAAGLGTADNGVGNDDKLHKFLVDKKEQIKAQLTTGNLLKTATSVGDIKMTKELLARGYQIADIQDTEWRKGLTDERKKNVERVSRQLERIAEQVNDQPTVLDNLGRIDYSHGLAALLLNPYIKPPIVVGISGTWGMGKSSLMVQTESILLKTAAQMALLPSAKLSSLASELPEITTSDLSKKGKMKYEEIKRHVDFEQKGNRNLFSTMMDKIWIWIKKSNREDSRAEIGHTQQDTLAEFLNSYQSKYRKIFKSLAAMDSSDMFTKRARQDPHSKSMCEMARDMLITNNQRSKSSPQQSAVDSPVDESVPAVLTVQYNAWKYRNETEALAGMAVEITKELEGIMTEAQWLSTCWRNTWKKKKYNIWIEIIYPCLLAVVLACTITWILWVILDRSDKFKDWAIPKYACLPTGIVIIGWAVTKSVMGILKPVSTQLMSYISFPDHTDKLGYQEKVISDINFLKDEIGKRPCMIFKAYSWVFTVISTLWLLFIEWWFTPLFFHTRILGKTMLIPNITPASGTNLRIIVFIDDLDRCQESVILQVLSAINLVLAVCEINVVLGIDKGLIERAIIKKYGDMKSNRSFKDNQELADKYLQKIIQLPLDLPDPSKEQSWKFLETHLGIFQEPGMAEILKQDADSELEQDEGMAEILRQETFVSEAPEVAIDMHPATKVTKYGRTRLILQFFKGQLCKLFLSSPSVCCGRKDEVEATQGDATQTGREDRQQGGDAVWSSSGEVLIAKHTVNKRSHRNHWSCIPIRELLFVSYSKGEQDAFCYFQKLATDTRKLPREWKRHLTYHRLVWYIFYLTGEAKDLAGWQVQLITWIFVCWEWQENLNFIIQNWNKVGALKSIESNGPSLQMIVDHFIELENQKHMKGTVASPEKVETKEAIPEARDTNNRNNGTESTKTEQKKSEKAFKDIMPGVDAGPSEKTLREEMDELKKEIKDLKDQVMKQHSMKNEKREEEKKIKLKRWRRLRSALEKYDIPMDGILAFQRFRFYCIAGHLSWPLPEQENNEN